MITFLRVLLIRACQFSIIGILGCSASQPELHLRILNGDLEGTQNLISRRSDINTRNRRGFTPLHLAVMNDQYRIVEVLIDAGAAVSERTIDGDSPLALAARLQTTDIAELLIQRGVQIHHFSEGPSPLFDAIKFGHTGLVETMLNKGANVNYTDYGGETPLFYAAYYGKIDIVRLLIKHGANINSKTKDSRSPLHGAVFGGYEGIAERLLESGARIYPAEDSEEGLYATAILYNFVAKTDVKNQRDKNGINNYRRAKEYFDKASKRFKSRADQFGKKIMEVHIGNFLSEIFASFSARQLARTSDFGVGVSFYVVRGTTDIESLKNKYLVVSKKCVIESKRIKEIIKCYQNNQGNLRECTELVSSG